jgi:excisionase family DNA binding protein
MTIQDLIKCGENVTIAVKPSELKEFAMYVMAETAKAKDAERKVPEVYLTPKETAEMIGVSTNTLWRWEKEKYLTPFKIGRKSRYRKSDVEALLKGKEV